MERTFKKADILLPSMVTCTIREQNGGDDDIISSLALKDEADGINAFIKSIVLDYNNAGPFKTIEEVEELKLRDKYFILISSRIFSLGKDMKFKYVWDDAEAPVEYVENLENYLWDYSLPFPKPGDPLYFFDKIKPYTHGEKKSFEFELSTGVQLKVDLMDGKYEKFMLGLNKNQYSKNTELKGRNLRIKDDNGVYQEVVDFSYFKSTEMVEIRKYVLSIDENFNGITKITNPRNGTEIELRLLGISDFFYPTEI